MEENYSSAYIYEQTDYDNPKEVFKFVGNIIEKNIDANNDLTILDVGCAKGEFLYYLKQRFHRNNLSLYGVDFSQKLISMARQFDGLQGVKFYNERAEQFKIEKKFDIITATGIICFFDDYTPFLTNLLTHLKPDGVLISTCSYAVHDYDILVKYRRYDDTVLEPGWNQHSIKGIEKWMLTHRKTVTRHKFHLPFSLDKSNDVLRSWTIDTNEGQKFTCGLNLIWNLWALEIK